MVELGVGGSAGEGVERTAMCSFSLLPYISDGFLCSDERDSNV